MDVGKSGKARIGVIAGSVWESRMKLDEFRGGIKVFSGEENSEENRDNTGNNAESVQEPTRNLVPKQNLVGVRGRRKTWKSERFYKNPIQNAKQRSESAKSLECNELSESIDGVKRSPITVKKTRSELGASVDGVEKSSVQPMKARPISLKGSNDAIQLRTVKSETDKIFDDSSDVNDKNPELMKITSDGNRDLDEPANGNKENPFQLTKAKSIPNKGLGEAGKSLNGLGNGIKKSSVELKKARLEAHKVVGETNKVPAGSSERTEKSPGGIRKTRSDENCKNFGVCEEKFMTSNLSNAGLVKSPPEVVVTNDDNNNNNNGVEGDWDEKLEEDFDEEIEAETVSFDVKEISISEQTPKKTVIQEKKFHQDEKPLPISPIVKKTPLPIAKSRPNNGKTVPSSPSPTAISQQNNERSVPMSPIVRKQPFAAVHSPRTHQNPTKVAKAPVSDAFQQIPRTHSKLQSLVDMIMWRDVSRTAFVFGTGTFLIVSSSYTQELNISLISVVSYLGLVHLAVIFIFRSIICRGAVDIQDTSQDYVVGEEEAFWLLKLVLPYLNEVLSKLRALFSGDPATTMKLAVLLFVLARCGSSITIWKLAKLSFFGVFAVPKVCSSYSTQLTAYGKFWIRRFQDAWNSCSHKKAVAFGIFTFAWNLSSIVARIWAVFILFVAFRYYQRSLVREDLIDETAMESGDTSWKGQIGRHKHGSGHNLVDTRKEKKRW